MNRERDYAVIWPAYFDSKRTRLEGRKVPKKLAVESPSIELIFEVCKELGLDPILEKGKRLPRSHWEGTGRVLIRKTKKKNELVMEIAKALLKRSSLIKIKPK
ncbi:MAG: signal recognition particle subunit SRP19/SEC65 family protein [Candidatus Methanomethylicaceae archaeon]